MLLGIQPDHCPLLLLLLASDALYTGGTHWLGWESSSVFITLFSLGGCGWT